MNRLRRAIYRLMFTRTVCGFRDPEPFCTCGRYVGCHHNLRYAALVNGKQQAGGKWTGLCAECYRKSFVTPRLRHLVAVNQ